MTIELIKEYSKTGGVSYHVKVDGVFVSGTVCFDLPNAMEAYDRVRDNATKERSETLIRELI